MTATFSRGCKDMFSWYSVPIGGARGLSCIVSKPGFTAPLGTKALSFLGATSDRNSVRVKEADSR